MIDLSTHLQIPFSIDENSVILKEFLGWAAWIDAQSMYYFIAVS